MQGFESLIFLGLLIAIFYFMLIRPQKKRVEEHRRLVSSVDPGDRIVTIGGIFGTVKTIGDEEVQVEIAPGTDITIVKTAIARRLEENLDDGADHDTAEEPA